MPELDKKFITVNPEDMEALREKIFGNYEYQSKMQVYYGKSEKKSLEEISEIITDIKDIKDIKDHRLDKLLGTSREEYFHDELLNKGKNYRIFFELSKKLTDGEETLNAELDKKFKMSDEQKNKAKEYYKAFVGTIAAVYTTAQAIDSRQLVLDSSDIKASIISNAVSFVPIIGNSLSSIVDSAGNFIKAKDIKENARKIKKLASDSVALNQCLSKAILKIVADQNKLKQIVNITREELEKSPDGFFEKIRKLYKDLGKEFDSTLYGKMYETPAADLGNKDANKLIEKWQETPIQKEFDKTVLQIIADCGSHAGLVHKDAIIVKKPGCCNVFYVDRHEYDNQILNHPDILDCFITALQDTYRPSEIIDMLGNMTI